MKPNKKSLPILTNIPIVDIAAEGKAIAKLDNWVIFIPTVAPGDIVDLQLTKKRKSYGEAKAILFHHFSEDRAVPFCEHFGTCGGCKWQHLTYEKQLHYKRKQVIDNLERIGKIELPEISPILGCLQTTFYRNKLEFTFSNNRWMTQDELHSDQQEYTVDKNALGFHIPALFDKVLDIKSCWLQSELSNQIRNSVKAYAIEHHMPFFDLRKQNGWLRNMIIRSSTTGEVMVIMVFYFENAELRNKLLEFISKSFPQVTSLVYIINEKANDSITDQQVHLFHGRTYIVEQMESLQFKIGPKSFYQTNSKQAYELYKIVREFAQLSGKELVYDLYTGTGTIANFIAKNVAKVIGIEYVPEAIEDAKANALLNHVNNTLFFAGDIKDVMNNDFVATYGTPDVLITDPPRAGMHKQVVEKILELSPKRIVYVSCNPATQARDLQLLDESYVVTKVQPVDMFPHTQHIENVVQLTRR
ncbi:23S rRNA (uracil(1939)-C(5))-methyltransferase RlmD [Microbacter margulisiae]|uniref:23S rRNA (Uracil1939-C5)-methyltransferase n=1 Tax=Microbacter margulisiae TaxID=1350067 RepID=A0A7W5DNZ4_9PORP|nr:23S rRNA (uracil1939-C5)-methyltransferase [Microbacter margulisiae]